MILKIPKNPEFYAYSFWLLVVLSTVSLGIYIVGVNATVRNTVLREDLERQSSELTTKISEMEFTYIGLENKVNLALALERGFEEVSNPEYISRTHGLSYNTR